MRIYHAADFKRFFFLDLHISVFLLGIHWISVPAGPASVQIQLWPNFQLDSIVPILVVVLRCTHLLTEIRRIE